MPWNDNRPDGRAQNPGSAEAALLTATIRRARGVAQPGSALRSGRRGPQFKSGHPDREARGRRRGERFPALAAPGPAAWSTWHSPRGADAASTRDAALCSRRAARRHLRRRLHARAPGPDLGPAGYRELGLRHGLELDPERYEEARAAAFAEVKRHPELDHDEEIWVLFTERIIQGMGGVGDTYGAAVEMERRWAHSAHFELYDDALPALDRFAARGLKIGLLSNSSRDLDEFVATTASPPTPCSPRTRTGRPSRTRRSSARCSTCSASTPATR